MFYWSLTEIIWRYLIESQVTDWQIFIDNEMAWILSGLNFSAPLSRWKSICPYKRLSEIYLVLPNLTGLGRIEIDHHLSVTCVGSAGLQFIYLAGGRLEENKKKRRFHSCVIDDAPPIPRLLFFYLLRLAALPRPSPFFFLSKGERANTLIDLSLVVLFLFLFFYMPAAVCWPQPPPPRVAPPANHWACLSGPSRVYRVSSRFQQMIHQILPFSARLAIVRRGWNIDFLPAIHCESGKTPVEAIPILNSPFKPSKTL